MMAATSRQDGPASTTTPAAKPRRHWWQTTRRTLFNGLCVISALLCLAVIALNIRAFWIQDSLWIEYKRWKPERTRPLRIALSVASVNGVGAVSVLRVDGDSFGFERVFPSLPDPKGLSFQWRHEDNKSSMMTHIFRFRAYHDSNITAGPIIQDRWALGMPLWSFALLFACSPGLKLWLHIRQRKRERPGFCIHCGYDLRASKDKCPECGAAMPGSPPSGL